MSDREIVIARGVGNGSLGASALANTPPPSIAVLPVIVESAIDRLLFGET